MTVGQIAVAILDRLAAAKGVGREALANRLGVTRQTVTSRFRNRSMTLDDYVGTCDALGADPAGILTHATAPCPKH